MHVVMLAAGAGGMYCGSCIRDNRLAARLIADGRQVSLVPLYTPLKTDEQSVSTPDVYYGGVNVYLQQKSSLFRRTPRFLDRLLDWPALLRGAASFAARTRPEDLGALTVSVLRGEDGLQRKELERLAAGLAALKPAIVNLPNLMFVGVAKRLKAALGCAVVCTLSGEDIFIDKLPARYRDEARALIAAKSRDVDAFIGVTRYFATHATRAFGLPADRVHVVPMGVPVDDFVDDGAAATATGTPFTIGYLARICHDKGLHNLVDAFAQLARDGRDIRLHAAGWLGAADKDYFSRVQRDLARHGVHDRFHYAGELSREQKRDFLRSVHVLSVPTEYHEAKGLYVLEALAAGVPVVQPAHGAFPELIEATGGGLLHAPGNASELAASIARLMDDAAHRAQLAVRGRAAVIERFSERVMADQTWALYERFARGEFVAPARVGEPAIAE